MDTMLTAHSSGSVQQLTPTTSLSFMALASVELIAHRVVWRKALIEPISTQSRLSPIRHELLLVRYRTHLVPISCATPPRHRTHLVPISCATSPRPISNSSSSDIEHISCPSRVQLLLVVQSRTQIHEMLEVELSCALHSDASVCSHRGVGLFTQRRRRRTLAVTLTARPTLGQNAHC